MTCVDCVSSFFFTPWKLSIVFTSVLISVSFFILMKRSSTVRSKLLYLYAHLFAGVFPFMFYAFYRGCQTLFSQCQTVKPLFILFIMTGVSTLLLSVIVAPILFLQRHMRGCVEAPYVRAVVAKNAKKLNMVSPELYVVNQQRPLAFSLAYWKAKIFVSVGLIEIMSKHELEAILTHELGHIQRKSSFLKISTSLFHMISPFRQFASFHNELNEEEYFADNVAVQLQGTKKYIVSARKKIDEYELARKKTGDW